MLQSLIIWQYSHKAKFCQVKTSSTAVECHALAIIKTRTVKGDSLPKPCWRSEYPLYDFVSALTSFIGV